MQSLTYAFIYDVLYITIGRQIPGGRAINDHGGLQTSDKAQQEADCCDGFQVFHGSGFGRVVVGRVVVRLR